MRHRVGERHVRALGHRQRDQEQQREEGDRGEQHLVLAAEVRRRGQPDQAEEAGELDRSQARVHPEQLVQADRGRAARRRREDQAAGSDDEDREGDRRDRDQTRAPRSEAELRRRERRGAA